MLSVINLLILDDSQEFIFLLTSFLNLKGINVDAEFDASKAIEKLKTQKYDIIITDYLMDEIDGISFAEKIKDSELNKNTEIILLTAKDLESEELKKVQELELKYLKKPILPNDLLSEITKAVKK